jgi:hypothetical protein
MKKTKNKRDITYAEANGCRPFNWNEWLDRVIKAKSEVPSCLDFDNTWDREYAIVVERAKSWVTCSCGNQCAIIPRDSYDGRPLDEELHHLGTKFYQAIKNGQWKGAKSALSKIEKRSAKLISKEVERRIKEAAESLAEIGYELEIQ